MVTLPHRRKHHAGWIPTRDSGLYVWHAADRQGGADGVAVSQLTDLSGNGRHATTGASKPIYRASGVKSRPSFDFVGSRSIAASIAAFTGSELAWFMAVKLSSSSSANGRFVSCSGTGLDFDSVQRCIPAYVSSPSSISVSAGRNLQFQLYTSGRANGSDLVLVSVFGASRFDLWANGVAGGGHATGGAFNFTQLEYGRGGFGEFANGMIAEVFALTGTVDATRRAVSEGYLIRKYL